MNGANGGLPLDEDAKAKTRARRLPSQPQTMTAVDLLAILRRRAKFIMATVVVLTILSGVVAATMVPQYRAIASVLLTSDQGNVINAQSMVQNRQDVSVVDTQIRVLKSRSFAARVVDALDLIEDPYFNPALRPPEKPSRLAVAMNTITEWVLTPLGIASGNAELKTPDEETNEELKGAVRTALLGTVTNKLIGGLNVSQDGQSSVVSISFTSPHPKKSAAMANAVADLFIENQLGDKLEEIEKASEWLDNRVNELRRRLLQSENEIARYRSQEQLLSNRRISLDEQQIGEIMSTLIVTRSEIEERLAKLDLIRGMRKKNGGLTSATEIMNSPVIASLRQEELRLVRDRASLLQEYGPNHPKIADLNARRLDLEDKIGSELDNIVGVLENELTIAQSKAAALGDSLEAAKVQLGERDGAEVQLNELIREADANRQLYTTFLNRQKELGEQRDLVRADARVISNAIVPGQPSFPQPKLILVAGFTSSIILGTLLALVRESLERGLRSARQVEQLLGLKTLSVVPRLGRLTMRNPPHHYIVRQPKSSYAEAIRNVWISLHLMENEDPEAAGAEVIMITSPLPAEGKTTLTTSLATSTANAGYKTALLDLDMRHPSVARELLEKPAAGLFDYVMKDRDLIDVVHRDDEVKNLDIVAGTEVPANPVDMLASERLNELLAELKQNYDYVFVDAPPVLGITDTKVLAQMVDVVILAVCWGKTNDEAAQNALDSLSEAMAPVAGVVMTQVNMRRHAQLAYGDSAQYYKKYKRYYHD